MSLYDSASLVMIPSGYKAGKLYSIKPTDGTGDFTVARTSIASRINDDGLIENVAANVPRINYPSCPSVLLEPARTNLITYPVSFINSYWNKTGASVGGDPSTAGTDILDGWDFNTWVISAATVNDADTFTTAATGGVRLDNILTVGKIYMMTIDGTTAAANVAFRNYAGSTSYLTFPSGAFTNTFYFVAVDAGIYIRNGGAGQTTINMMTLQEVTGYTSPSADYPNEAYRMTAVSASGTLELAVPITITSGNDYTNSIWVKRVTGTGNIFLKDINGIDIQIEPTTTWAKYELSTDAVGTSGTIGVEILVLGDAIDIFGAQLEQGSYPTSFIYDGTEGATVNRAAETAIVSDLIVNGILTATEGTIVDNRDGVSYAYRYTSDGNMELFIDGVSQGSIVQSVPTSYSLVVPSKTEQVTMYPVPLTDEEINSLK